MSVRLGFALGVAIGAAGMFAIDRLWPPAVLEWQVYSGVALVTDGDTIQVAGQVIRFADIDAPESGQQCTDATAAKYPCGQKATAALKDMLAGKTVTCRETTHRRSYERVIARCFVGADDIQAAMVRAGWAVAYRRYSLTYVGEEEAAHAAHAGIWAGSFVEPEKWRHSRSARNG